MKKLWVGWTVAIFFILAFGILWVNYSDLKKDYQMGISQNYQDFHSGIQGDIGLMEQILALEKLLAEGQGDLQAYQAMASDRIFKGSPLVYVEMPETEWQKFLEYRANSLSAIIEYQQTGTVSKIKELETNLSAYKKHFNQWVEKENKCSDIEAFCVSDGTEVD